MGGFYLFSLDFLVAFSLLAFLRAVTLIFHLTKKMVFNCPLSFVTILYCKKWYFIKMIDLECFSISSSINFLKKNLII